MTVSRMKNSKLEYPEYNFVKARSIIKSIKKKVAYI